MLSRLLFSAIIAGVLAGVAVAALQHFTTTPLILEAETYEGAGEEHVHPAAQDNASGAPVVPAQTETTVAEPEEEEWAPADGFQRTAYTSVATIGSGVGFALILLSLMVLSNAQITARTGLMWGTAAFTATGLATALGLSPELPGSAAAALEARQLWWIGTAIASGAGLWLILRLSSPLAIVIGAVLIVAPHVVGAPHPSAYTSAVPGELSGHFASASLVAQALCWALAGSIAGYVWQRLARSADDAVA